MSPSWNLPVFPFQFQNTVKHIHVQVNLGLQMLILLSCLSDEIIYLFISWPRNRLDCIMNWVDFPGGTVVKNLPASIRNAGSISGLGRFLPGKFHGRRSLVGIVHGVAKSWTWLSEPHTHVNWTPLPAYKHFRSNINIIFFWFISLYIHLTSLLKWFFVFIGTLGTWAEDELLRFWASQLLLNQIISP